MCVLLQVNITLGAGLVKSFDERLMKKILAWQQFWIYYLVSPLSSFFIDILLL